ncbi:ATP-binding cassette domain-containing protein [Bacillus atrophaeus]|uniref:ABC transporter ATP-binding protein n=1 Tax=Bacillus atrophaeus TaxID=1452 RepID=UPI00227FCEDD|nr:ATP-binding cassette domain-containing protein [Bacillus atrophaeus]MCY8911703.1 ATP-binding cassette domain-containing protein [Bacillus atrophaeus]MCY9115221.1 ATP-binding cassette domain-containing protein [Bacillus atrophaeus]MEC0924718.1 ATP-binding cassette domain-containing protein [Bacillus atrophaeus]MEC0933332.1 ATP-binding cassette domain-containing protein [Bacillus atrophaeus]
MKETSMNSGTSAISFTSVTKSYEQNGASYEVLQGITGEVKQGDFVMVLGPSGSGKSTLLSICNLMKTPDEGEVYIHGKEVRDWNISELRRTVGLAFQSAPVIDGTVRDNLSLAAKLHQKQLFTPEELARLTGLSDELLDRSARDLSGGQRQKLSLARTLSNPSSILLLDEITSALDPVSALEIEELIIRLHQEKKLTVMWVTHNIEQAKRVADTIWFMADGRVLETAESGVFFTDPKHEAAREFLKGGTR